MLHHALIKTNWFEPNHYLIGVYASKEDLIHVVLMQHGKTLHSITNAYEQVAAWALRNIPEVKKAHLSKLVWHECWWPSTVMKLAAHEPTYGSHSTTLHDFTERRRIERVQFNELKKPWLKELVVSGPGWGKEQPDIEKWLLVEIERELSALLGYTPSQALHRWVHRHREEGHLWPVVYSSEHPTLEAYGYNSFE